MIGFKADNLDVYRLKAAQTEGERVRVMDEAIAKAVEKAQINYLLQGVTLAVLLVALVQSLTIMGISPVPVAAYPSCVLVMTIMVVLPWQSRRLRILVWMR